MKKRLCTVLLMTTMVLSMTACGKEKKEESIQPEISVEKEEKTQNVIDSPTQESGSLENGLFAVSEDLSSAMALGRYDRLGTKTWDVIIYPTKVSESEYVFTAEQLAGAFNNGDEIAYCGFEPNTVQYIHFFEGDKDWGSEYMNKNYRMAGLNLVADTSKDITIVVGKTSATADVTADKNLQTDYWGNPTFIGGGAIDVIGDSDVIGDTDVIGDVDAGELSVSNCREWQMGLDIQNKPFNNVEMTFADKILFPNATYVTTEGNGYLKAEGTAIESIEVTIIPVQSIPNISSPLVSDGTNVVGKKVKYDNDSSYNATYNVQEAAGCYSMELLIRSKKGASDSEIAVYRTFVEEFVPAFDEMLLSNFN